MASVRSSLRRRHVDRPVTQQIGAHRVYVVRQEPAWADAWPHVDDWFKTDALLRQRGMHRPITRM